MNWARCDNKCIVIFVESTSYFCQNLIKNEFTTRIFQKYSKFHEDPSSGTDRHDEADSRFKQFCKRVYDPINNKKPLQLYILYEFSVGPVAQSV
jgi:thioredoxin-related protein